MYDPYILKNGTLRNKLGIADYKELKNAECDLGFVKLISLDAVDCNCSGEELIKRVHKHIFEDVFDWAGRYRTVPIYKTELVIPGISLKYCDPENIKDSLQQNISSMQNDYWNNQDLDNFAKKLTLHLAKIWRVHPFRDGNTRTALAYGYLFAKQHGVDLDIGKIADNLCRKIDDQTGKVKRYSIRDKFVLAALDTKDYPEPEALQDLLRQSMTRIEREKTKEAETENEK